MVVIVSEETGSISVAVDGMLKRHLAPQTLERLLRKELVVEEPEQETGVVAKAKKLLAELTKEDGNNEKQ